MSKTLQLTPPPGYRFDSVDNLTGAINIVEIPKNIRDRINDFSDILRENNLSINQYEEMIKGLSLNSIGYEACKLIVNAYNEGVRPEYGQNTLPKYFPRFNMPTPSGDGFSYFVYDDWETISSVGSRLDFCGKEAKENMLDAVAKFLPYYKQLMTT